MISLYSLSFNITYILLLTTATITFIEALRTKSDTVRHILNLETCISLVAGYFYSQFVKLINSNTSDITQLRYTDWMITTPMMLLSLCLVLCNKMGTKVSINIILSIWVLNYMMLGSGYLGEVGVLSRENANILGFIPFIGMFYIIYINYVKPDMHTSNIVFYTLYCVIWAMYGIAYMISDIYKNILFNILDCIAKCLFGIGIWSYYANIIVI